VLSPQPNDQLQRQHARKWNTNNITEREAKHNTKCDDDDDNDDNNNDNNNNNNNKGKVKVKFTPEQVTKTQRGSKCIVILFLEPRR